MSDCMAGSGSCLSFSPPLPGRKKLIFKLEAKMGFLPSEHFCNLEIKLLTPQKGSSMIPFRRMVAVVAVRIHQKAK